MAAPLVFLDIAGPDKAALQTFYSSLFGWDTGGTDFPITVSGPLLAAIREDPAEKRFYIGVEDIAATLEQIETLGGSVDVPRFEVPGVVILGLFRDPAGNPMGLVEIANGAPIVP